MLNIPIAIAITNPIAPIINKPMAETLEIVKNSSLLGLRNNRHTLLYCVKLNLNFGIFIE